MKSEQREYIIELASKMFVNNGVKSVTMSDIANAASISKRTLYEEFRDKEELLYLSSVYYFSRLDEQDQQRIDQSPNILIGMLRVTENVSRNSDLNWRLYRNIKISYPAVYKRISQKQMSTINDAIERLTRGVDEGLISPHANLMLSVTMLYYVASNLVHDNGDMLLPEGATAQSAFWEFSINFMRGIATPRGIEIIDEYIENRD